MGRPRTNCPPCPRCGTQNVVRHDIWQVNGEPARRYRCRNCPRLFVPGQAAHPTEDLKAAVRRVRQETQAPYRLIATAVTHQLGVPVSHTTVNAWCREAAEGDHVACDYLSVLWALRHEIESIAARS